MFVHMYHNFTHFVSDTLTFKSYLTHVFSHLKKHFLSYVKVLQPRALKTLFSQKVCVWCWRGDKHWVKNCYLIKKLLQKAFKPRLWDLHGSTLIRNVRHFYQYHHQLHGATNTQGQARTQPKGKKKKRNTKLSKQQPFEANTSTTKHSCMCTM